MNLQRETLLCQYRYDGLDRLIGNELPDRPAFHRFYYKSRLATEIQGVMQYSIIQHDDQLLAQRQRDGDGIDTTLLATDLQRSVLRTLKKDNQPQPIAYSPYGHRPAFSGLLSLLGFNGERPDPVTGHYLLGNGYRAFNPVLMRFNSPDSLSPFGKGGFNSYAYCGGDPVNRADPTGHSWFIDVLEKLNMQHLNFSKLDVNRAITKLTKTAHKEGIDITQKLGDLDAAQAERKLAGATMAKEISKYDKGSRILKELHEKPTSTKVLNSIKKLEEKKHRTHADNYSFRPIYHRNRYYKRSKVIN
jgi:RHS repeat-associated protein